jgi:hypothetical protein
VNATSNDELLKQLTETENSHDVEKVLTLLTDDIVFEDVTFGVVMNNSIRRVYIIHLCVGNDINDTYSSKCIS